MITQSSMETIEFHNLVACCKVLIIGLKLKFCSNKWNCFLWEKKNKLIKNQKQSHPVRQVSLKQSVLHSRFGCSSFTWKQYDILEILEMLRKYAKMSIKSYLRVPQMLNFNIVHVCIYTHPCLHTEYTYHKTTCLFYYKCIFVHINAFALNIV